MKVFHKFLLVGPEGIGPSTSVLSGQRSTNELWTPQKKLCAGQRSTNELWAHQHRINNTRS